MGDWRLCLDGSVTPIEVRAVVSPDSREMEAGVRTASRGLIAARRQLKTALFVLDSYSKSPDVDRPRPCVYNFARFCPGRMMARADVLVIPASPAAGEG